MQIHIKHADQHENVKVKGDHSSYGDQSSTVACNRLFAVGSTTYASCGHLGAFLRSCKRQGCTRLVWCARSREKESLRSHNSIHPVLRSLFVVLFQASTYQLSWWQPPSPLAV